MGPLGRHVLAAVLVGGALLPLAAALRVQPARPLVSHLAAVPSKEIKVIGAGATRTGTQSMTQALTLLGFRPAHQEITYNLTLRKPWLEWERGGPFEPALQSLLDIGIDATTADDPWGAAYKELMERFPNAKVVLTKHPGGPEGWMRSVEKAVTRPLAAYVNGHKNNFADYWDFVFEGCVHIRHCRINETMTDEKRRGCMKNYQDNIDEVRRTVPPERLLEFTVTDGWGPLVKFLGLPTPPMSFPRADAMGVLQGEFAAIADETDDQLFKVHDLGYY